MTIGSILGACCAYFAYRQYYPSLSHDSCTDPFVTRVAFCKKCVDEESGIIVPDSNIALVPQQSSKFQPDDNYSEGSSTDYYGNNHMHKLSTQSSGAPLIRNGQ